jgi:very-short-patch-repair endonuclease
MSTRSTPARPRLPLVERTWLPPDQARRVAGELAEAQEAVVTRRQLCRAGVPRWLIHLEVRVGRWQCTGKQTVVLHNGPLSPPAQRWIAVLETGLGAALDGVSALQQAGLTMLTDEQIDVIVAKGATPAHPPGVRVHESRRFREQDVISAGIRRVRPAVAAVHAALWAATDRQATYFLLLAVQQRVARVSDIAEAVGRIRRHKRRVLLRALVVQLSGGVQALSELDVAADFRRRSLPEPQRQVVRRRPSGTQYLDCDLPEYAVTLEIDGAGHDEPQQRLSDLVRDITLAAEGRLTVRLPMAVYVLDRDRVLDALEELFLSRGWRPAAA